MTVFVDENEINHIFWERYTHMCDVPNYYWLHHVAVDENGDVVVDAELFYFEKKDGGCGLCIVYPWWLLAIAIPIVIAIVMFLIHNMKKKKRS